VNIVYFGSGAFGLPTVEALAAEHAITAVVTQPDRKAGRGGKMTPTPIGAWADEHLPGVPLLKPEKVGEPEIRDRVRAFEADAWVIIAFGQWLPPELLTDRFAINLHASLLPRWRGAAPINAAIVAGDTETGNSVITLARKMDAGLVLGQSRRPVEPTQTFAELHDLLALDGPELVGDVLARHASGTLEPVTQDESRVTLAPKFGRTDAAIDLRDPAEISRCKVNGYSPRPGVTVSFRGEALKLLRADSQGLDGASEPGEIVDPSRGLVACGPGTALRLIDVQPAGRKPMPWVDFARGRSVDVGDRIEPPPVT
jgi:methionyl-tRNA formyltransferase